MIKFDQYLILNEEFLFLITKNFKAFIPWREAEFTSRFKGRQDLIEYAKAKGFPVPATPAAPYSVDSNILHIR
jgi:argininosuccinate synthase